MKYIEISEEEFEEMRQGLSDALAQVAKLTAQLDACGQAAQAVFSELPKTSYSWSPEFERIVKLRKGYDALCKIKL